MVLEQLPDLAKARNPAGEPRPAARHRPRRRTTSRSDASHPPREAARGRPRARAVVSPATPLYVANYSRTTLSIIDLAAPQARWSPGRAGPKREMNAVRTG